MASTNTKGSTKIRANRELSFSEISYNFSIAKIFAIFAIATGHYFQGSILWIPTTYSLILFAFSSGYFTSKKYKHPFKTSNFWKAKFFRLLLPIVIINSFLFILFIIQKKSGLFVWQSIMSSLGIGVILQWLKIENPSPFGHGLWFFTILFSYYLLFPIIERINRNAVHASLFLVSSFLSTAAFYFLVPFDYMLWMTIFSFIIGSYCGFYEYRISALICIFIFILSNLLLIFLNLVLHFNFLNYILLLVSSLAIIGFLLDHRLPKYALRKLLFLSNCMIQIYFIHTYLFFKNTNYPLILNYLISVAIIYISAFLLNKITIYIQNKACYILKLYCPKTVAR